MAREDRKHDRLEVGIVVNLYSPGSAVPRGRAFIRDVSLGGIGLETVSEFALGDMLNLDFTLPNGNTFKDIEGRIVRLRKDVMTYNIGIRFTKIRFLDKLKIWWFAKRK